MFKCKKILALVLAIVAFATVAVPAWATEGIANGGTGIIQLSDSSSYVNMRNSASTSGAIRARLGHGTTLTVLSSTNGTTVNGSSVWYRVQIVTPAGNTNASSGQTGYVHSYYVGAYSGGNVSTRPWTSRYGDMVLNGHVHGAATYIRNLQEDLNEWFTYIHDFDDAAGNPFVILDTPGYYANWTISGVIRFQSYYNLSMKDGVVGDETKEQLWIIYKSLHP